MYHIVYLTTNLVNLKIYVGVHSTWNLNDSYLGSGTNLLKSIKKYGTHNFNRKILYYCYDVSHAYELEKNIVNHEFIARNDTYNLIIGGKNSYNIGRIKTNISQEVRDKISLTHKGKIVSDETKIKIREKRKQQIFTIETREKLSKSRKGKPSEKKGTKILNKKSYKHWIITDNKNNIYDFTGSIKEFCDNHNINLSYIYNFINKGEIISKTNSLFGWEFTQL